MVIERISGDAPPDYFIGPSWCLDKPAVKRAIEAEFARRDTWQGKLLQVDRMTGFAGSTGWNARMTD